MSRMARAGIAAAAVVVLVSVAIARPAAAQEVAGRWAIMLRGGVRGTLRGELRLEAKGSALGGTLWQDISTQKDGALVHRDWHRYDETGHAIRVEPDSWVARVYGGRFPYVPISSWTTMSTKYTVPSCTR